MSVETKEYKERIVEALAEGYELDNKKAEQLLEKADFDKFFNEVPEAALNYTPEYWADKIIISIDAHKKE